MDGLLYAGIGFAGAALGTISARNLFNRRTVADHEKRISTVEQAVRDQGEAVKRIDSNVSMLTTHLLGGGRDGH